ncbi:hypothetical protein [Chryseobacterium sp. SL1]|uniref:hypothetical protein n=1 Tax=Chryseobacterium sp. SL1 TaxID=2995159 RepID=UPI002276B89D|nr:hypothetical protein [Chryseobacterium sp. SL1]MCY1662758.1 hypothetical protein [Chryseobacterium sp. SL1]
MEFYLDLRFIDTNYDASVHFATIYTASTEASAKQFFSELLAALERRKVNIIAKYNDRIDNNPELRKRSLENHNFYLTKSSAHIKIDHYYIEDPDQSMSITENLLQKFYSDKEPVAELARRVNVPVIVKDRQTRDDIRNDFYYFTLEHLTPVIGN